jgi:hypothetical protein
MKALHEAQLPFDLDAKCNLTSMHGTEFSLQILLNVPASNHCCTERSMPSDVCTFERAQRALYLHFPPPQKDGAYRASDFKDRVWY